ncbi:putative dehydrogenase [Catenulispora sp. GP43]
MDGQEDALAQGLRPGMPEWGSTPESRWGLLTDANGSRAVRAEPGSYEEFYRQLEAALRQGTPLPVDPASTLPTLDVIDAAVLSAREGRVVELTSQPADH